MFKESKNELLSLKLVTRAGKGMFKTVWVDVLCMYHPCLFLALCAVCPVYENVRERIKYYYILII